MSNENAPLEIKNDGIYLSKRGIFLAGLGALGSIAALIVGRHFTKFKPTLVSITKEGYAFKEWVSEKIERAKEDIEDVVAEAVHAYHEDVQVTKDLIQREKELLEKVEDLVKKRDKES